MSGFGIKEALEFGVMSGTQNAGSSLALVPDMLDKESWLVEGLSPPTIPFSVSEI